MSFEIADIRDAAAVLSEYFPPTPLLPAPGLSEQLGTEVLLKAENLQRTGSFKVRGAFNMISRLGGEANCPGVVCTSSGNHAQGVALAAKKAGITSTVVMPITTPAINAARARALGAHVFLWGETHEEAYQRALDIGRERDYVLVHSFEDARVIAGYGTIGLELLDQAPDLDAVILPVGGGGLAAGVAMAVKETNPEVAVYGVQAAGAAAVAASFEQGKPVTLERAETLAEAIRYRAASEITFPLLKRYLDGVLTVAEEEISRAIVRLLEETRMLAEGAGAVPLAALMSGRLSKPARKAALVISGGNMNLNLIGRVIEQGLERECRYLVVRTQVPDLPGRLHKLLSHFASKRVNVLNVVHRRAGWKIPLGRVEIELLLETRDQTHARELLADLKEAGYKVECERPPDGGAGGGPDGKEEPDVNLPA